MLCSYCISYNISYKDISYKETSLTNAAVTVALPTSLCFYYFQYKSKSDRNVDVFLYKRL